MAQSKSGLDFIVIGAQKAGTTSLFEYLRRHPQVCMPVAKEVPYFSHASNFRMPWEEYLHKAFTTADPSCLWGTATPHYMVGGLYERGAPPEPAGDERTVPLRIRERLPGVRLIAILRDPVQRARSHHAMARMNGWDHRSFEEAVTELLRPERLEESRRNPSESTGYITWGEYGRILSGYLDVFAAEQLLVLYTEDLKANPAAVIQRVFGFLGVAVDFVPDNLGTEYRVGSTARRVGWLDPNTAQAAAAGNRTLRRLWHALPEPTRRRIDRGFDRINYATDLWNRRRRSEPASVVASSVTGLREHYRYDGDRLASLLGDPPPWMAPREQAAGAATTETPRPAA